MRFLLGGGCLLGVCLAPSVASALVYEPNNVKVAPTGLLVPVDSSPETQLSTFFTGRGEAIDWHADAVTTPNAFAPVCGFTATFVLNQANNKYGIAWYNETGHVPAASDLHILVPSGSAVGTAFNGTDIRSDPAYAGGLVGFALVGGETHYTNSAYSTECTTTTVCNPSAPWITALVYASTATKNAYYLAFEDGATSASGWNNDGDFNDDVFFLTGISTNAASNGCAGTTPVCNLTCVACNGDFDSGATNACQASGAPRCVATGSCTAAVDAGAGDADADATAPEAGIGDAGEDVDAAITDDDSGAAPDASPADGGADATLADSGAPDAATGATDATIADASLDRDATTSGGAGDSGSGPEGDADVTGGSVTGPTSGCSCTLVGSEGGTAPRQTLLLAVVAAAALLRRKRGTKARAAAKANG